MQTNATQPQRTNSYLNAILTANAVILGVVALNSVTGSHGLDRVAQAQASTGEESPDARTSAAEQRKQMIAELRHVSQRMERIEGALSKGVSVKVTSMPPIPGLDEAIKKNQGETREKPAASPQSTIRPTGATPK